MKKLVIIALVFSLIAGYATYRFTQELKKDDTPETVKIVAANGQIMPFIPITAEMLKIVELPAQAVHSLSTTSTADIIGKVALAKLEDGETILSTKIIEVGKSGASLSYEIQSGYRAMTFSCDEVSGVAGYIAVGDSVDIIAIHNKQNDDGSSERFAIMVAENVEVLKTGIKKSAGEGEGGYSSLTLSVTSEDVLRYYYILSLDIYRFTLRSVTDDEILDTSDFTMK